jgi:hypothetical protein
MSQVIKKYLHILSCQAQVSLAYRFQAFVGILVNAVPVIATVFLWRAVYAARPAGTEIAGFSMKEMVTYLLETNAQLTNRESFPVYNIETYVLNENADFKLPPINQPLNAVFDNLLRIDAVFIQPAVSPGEQLPIALTLSPLAQMDADYKLSLRLVSPTGKRLAQKDRLLLHNYHQGTSLWPAETVNEYYLLPVPPQTPPGEYGVTAVIYHPDTGAALVAGGLAEVPLGTVQIE